MSEEAETKTYPTAMCDLCGLFEAKVLKEVENEETGERINAALCIDCDEKCEAYIRGEDVSFEDELRLSRGDSDAE